MYRSEFLAKIFDFPKQCPIFTDEATFIHGRGARLPDGCQSNASLGSIRARLAWDSGAFGDFPFRSLSFIMPSGKVTHKKRTGGGR
jgi:hypothetical protein